MRREFSAKVKEARWDIARGCCEECGAIVFRTRVHFDHDNPDGLTGEPTLDNCRVVCFACHKVKTKNDVKRIAKAKRLSRRAKGIKKKTTFRGWRNMKGERVWASDRK